MHLDNVADGDQPALLGQAVTTARTPYAVKNALTGQSVWKENFANSRAFYPLADSVAATVAGTLRTAALVAEGMSPLLAIVAVAAVVVMVASSAGRPTLVVLGPTAALLINMALVGAGKPGEFGRFALPAPSREALSQSAELSSPVRGIRPGLLRGGRGRDGTPRRCVRGVEAVV